jgi:alkylation response protein AidB-like acyl-CoA dehydrogenase
VIEVEDVEKFRLRARAWVRANLGPADPRVMVGVNKGLTEAEELAAVAHERDLQRKFFDAGLAGICVPREYGGQGLTPTHQQILREEMAGYEYPSRFMTPTMSPCLAVLVEFGTEEQKRRHVPAILKGDELWTQFLSEPTAGSDVAAALTTAVRDADHWVLNGSKLWTTGAWWSDWALCLARTNWEAPKHRGLTVFMFPIHQSGIELRRIELLNGSKDFCQEFLTDLHVPDTNRIGAVDDGWTVGIRWMFHERMHHNSPYVTVPSDTPRGSANSLTDIARDAGRRQDAHTRDLIGEARMLDIVERELQERLASGIRAGRISDQAAAIGRLFAGMASVRTTTIGFELAGSLGSTWSEADGAAAHCGLDYLMRQAPCIGGGTLEMARNVISERVLGMPREQNLSRDIAFRDVPRGAPIR